MADSATSGALARVRNVSQSALIKAVFALQPIAFGAWLPRIADVQRQLGFGPSDLALALLGMPAGILITLAFAGRIVGWLGARRTIIYGFAAFFLLVPLPAWSANGTMLFAALACLGSAMSLLELGLNVEADRIERSSGAHIMSTCHGFWSLGIMAGSLVGSALAQFGIAPHWAVSLVALLVLVPALLAASALPEISGETDPSEAARANGSGRISKPLLLISLFTFGITMTEGAIADWSSVYLRAVFQSAGGQSGLGYALFAAAVAAGRFSGDRLKRQLGVIVIARVCGGLALAGIGVVVLAPNQWVSLVGFLLTGLGVSIGFPIAVTAVAELPGRSSASNVAVLSFVALLGFLVGPPAIGFVAEYTNMRAGLGVLLPVLLLSYALIPALRASEAPFESR